MRIRDAAADDAAACAVVYAPYVTDTAITFEYDPPSVPEMALRIETSQRAHAWLVLEDDGRVVGYAHAGRHRDRAAYRWACEVSVYVEQGRRRTGAGRALYGVLFDRLVDRGYRIAVAGMTAPNPAGEGLHRAMGFTLIGVERGIGWKLGRWHDVVRMQKALATGGDPPAEPR